MTEHNSDPMALVFQYQSEARELRVEVERLTERLTAALQMEWAKTIARRALEPKP